MQRMIRSPIGLTALVVALTAFCAQAQFRQRPLTELERAIAAGDEQKLAAAKALAAGDKRESKDRYEKALERYEKALSLEPTSLAGGEGYGSCANLLGKHEETTRWLAPVLQAHPDSIEIAYQLGFAAFKLRDFERALPLLERVSAAMQPDHLLAHYYLGSHYLALGRGEPAVVEFQRYLKLRPEAAARNDFQILEMLGYAYLLDNRPAEARAALEQSQVGRAESLTVQLGLARAFELERKPADARKLLEGLSSRFSQAPDPKERLGRLLLAAGDISRADQVSQALLKLDQGAAAQALLGDVRLAQGNFKLAEAPLRKAVTLAPSSLDYRIALARAVQGQGRNEEAVSILEGVVEAGGSSPQAWAALGSVYRRAGRFQRAVEAHTKVIALLPKAALGSLLLGADHYATGQWDQAIEQYTRAMTLEPESEEARKWLARSLAQRARERAIAKRVEDAIRDLRRAYDLERTATMSRNLGAALLSDRKFSEAAEVLTAGVKLAGATWNESYLLGYAHLAGGDATSALTSFENAARLAVSGAPLSPIYVGWSLAKLELGDFDAAVTKLLELQNSTDAAVVSQANLPMALLRRALGRLRSADVEGARADLEAVDKLPGKQAQETVELTALVRALLAVESGDFRTAKRSLDAALKRDRKWAETYARPLISAYISYREEQLPVARRELSKLEKRYSAAPADWLAELGRAIDRRDGELAYRRGKLVPAQRALEAAGKSDPLNPYVIHNQACVQHRRGKAEVAVDAWKSVSATLPTAYLNLGIDAQERSEDFQAAYDFYSRYLARSAERRGLVIGWRNRLASIYGLKTTELVTPQEGAPEDKGGAVQSVGGTIPPATPAPASGTGSVPSAPAVPASPAAAPSTAADGATR